MPSTTCSGILRFLNARRLAFVLWVLIPLHIWFMHEIDLGGDAGGTIDKRFSFFLQTSRRAGGTHRRQKVLVFPRNYKRDEHKHIFVDGILRSDRLDLSLDLTDRNAYWFVDINRCTFEQLKAAMRIRADALGKDRDQTIIFADWSDQGWDEPQLAEYFQLGSDNFGGGNVHYVTRQHIDKRNIENITDDKEFSHYGDKWSWDGDEEAAEFGLGGRIKVARYSVRSDLVDSISKISGVKLFDGSVMSSFAAARLPRPNDVVSFWNPEDTEDPVSEAKSELRASVSKLVSSLGEGNSHLNVTVGTIGAREDSGRNSVDNAYTRALLQHKIVVVAQRDEWEGHYRLMEALAGGALVMSDPMHPFPYLIEDGVNIVVYTSLSELKEKILRYVRNETERLELAARGHHVAMNYHRSWHVMERIIFGNWTSEHY